MSKTIGHRGEHVAAWVGTGAFAVLLALAGCAARKPPPAPPAPPPPVAAATAVTVAPPPATPAAPPPPVAVAYEQAVAQAAREVFGNAQLAPGQTYTVVVDPLVDGTTGMQTVGTAAMEKRVAGIVASDYPRYEMKPFNAANVAAAPLIFIGTFTPINLLGKSDGEKDAYRICFALADLKTGKIVSKGFARSQTAGVDATPLPYFKDAPVWVADKIVEGYVKTCQGTKAGDPINAAYYDKISAATAIDGAISAYNSRQYRESLALFTALLRNPAGDQPRVHTGLYLSNYRLARREPAMRSFSRLVEYGVVNNRFAVNFNFEAGAASFARDRVPYDSWLREVARQTTRSTPGCYEIAGHTSRTGSAELNQRLSLMRAEYVKQRLVRDRRDLGARYNAQGYGSRQPLVGTGKDDGSDLLDRRTEFKPQPCTAT